MNSSLLTKKSPAVWGVFVALLVLAACFNLVPNVAYAQPDLTDVSFLRSGGYVIFFRHGAANVGGDQSGMPLASQWWMKCNELESRQLNPQGRTESVSTGRTFAAQNIRVSRVIASEYCRCYETAVLFNLGLPIQLSTIATMGVYTGNNSGEQMDALLRANEPSTGANVVVVGHGITYPGGPAVNMFEFASLGWGDARVLRRATTSTVGWEVVGTVRVATWSRPTSVASLASPVSPAQPLLRTTLGPNPAEATLVLNCEKPCAIAITNALGQEVYRSQAGTTSRNHTLDVAAWASGTYRVQCLSETAEIIATSSFVKSR
jgi:phosphohistidine phosphatase SixA